MIEGDHVIIRKKEYIGKKHCDCALLVDIIKVRVNFAGNLILRSSYLDCNYCFGGTNIASLVNYRRYLW